MAEPRIIIIGAGPAGVRAAETLIAAGLAPLVLDESARDGGQIYRRQPEGFHRPPAALYGTEAGRAEALHTTFDRLRTSIEYRPRHLVWNIAGNHAHTVHDGISEAHPYDALLIASGATDRLMPVKGWHRAGAYSLGAAQIALKAQALAIGHKVAFMGSGPLLYLVAYQYAKAGAAVAAVLDTSPFSAQVRALPHLLARPDVMAKGAALLLGLKRMGVPIHRGITPVEITGEDETGISGVTVRLASGEIRHIEADAVGMGWHLRPETQLADLAGCTFTFEPLTRQFFPDIDQDGRSTVPGVYLAGDGARTLGADGAEIAGKLAALALLADLGRPIPAGTVATLRRQRARMERFRQGLARAFPWPERLAAALPDEAILCRCEAIRTGEVRQVATAKGACEINRAKALSRVGMGRCQGRYCGHAAAEVIANAANIPVESVGRLRGQAPVKPVSISTVKGAS